MARKPKTGIFLTLATDFLAQSQYYGVMGIRPADLLTAYGVFRETDYYGHYENEEGHNFYRGDRMADKMGDRDRHNGGHYWVWTVLAEAFDDYLKKLLREELA